jgi:hypothetical protein
MTVHLLLFESRKCSSWFVFINLDFITIPAVGFIKSVVELRGLAFLTRHVPHMGGSRLKLKRKVFML